SRRQQTDRAAEQRAEHVGDRGRLEPMLEDDDQQAENDPEGDVEESVRAERLELKRRITNRRYEQNTGQSEPRHCELPGAGNERDVYESVNLRTAERENQAAFALGVAANAISARPALRPRSARQS